MGSSLAFTLKEDPVRCEKVCDEKLGHTKGCEQYLMDTFKMSETIAKDWFLKYHANEEDEIFDDDILMEDEEENVFHSENRLGSPLYTIEESENEDLIPDFETNSDWKFSHEFAFFEDSAALQYIFKYYYTSWVWSKLNKKAKSKPE